MMENEVEKLHKKIGSLYILIDKLIKEKTGLIKENRELKKQLIKK